MRSRPRLITLLVSGTLLAGVLPAAAGAQTAPYASPLTHLPSPVISKTRPKPQHDPDTVLVKFAKGASAASREGTFRKHGAADQGSAGTTGYHVARIEGSAEQAVRDFRADPSVEHAQLNYLRHASATPNDPALKYGDQEYLKQIRLLSAWDATKGSTAKTIAIIDTGIDLDHPEFTGRRRAGFNAITGGTNVADDNGHGTFVAGVAAAATNNNRGIAGAAWNAGILPVKVLDSQGLGTDADIAEGIRWAVDHGATVLNLSLGGPGDSTVLRDAINYAVSKNRVIIAAAGNEGWDVPDYPAAYGTVMAVTATDAKSNIAFFSNHGWWVDVAAPGIGIVSTYADSVEAYAIGDGTSFAAPLVAGIAFLLRIKNPSWTRAQVNARIRNTARDMGPTGIDPFYGNGRVDAAAALGTAAALPRVAQPAGDVHEPNPTIDLAKPITASLSGSISPEGDVDYYYRDVDATGSVTFTVTPPFYDPAAEIRASEMDPVIAVVGPDLTVRGIVDQTYLGQAETITVTVDVPGRYYAAVWNFFGSRSPSNYSLGVSTGVGSPALAFKPYRKLTGAPWVFSVEAGELTGDGRTDIVAFAQPPPWEPTGHDLLLYPQQATGGLGAPAHFPDAETSGSHLIALGDLTGDGKLDVAKPASGGIRVWPGTGTSFGTSFVIPSADQIGSIALIDHGLDGDLDILGEAAGGAGDVFLFTNDGGTFTRSTAVDATTSGLAAGDLTGDARADIVRVSGSTIVVYQQAPGGTFGAGVTYVSPGTLTSLMVADVTGDGLADVVGTTAGNEPASQLVVWEAQPGSTLVPGFARPSKASPEAIDIADVDGDGLNDVAVAHGVEVGIYRQQPDGSLGTEAVYAIPSNLAHSGVALADVSGDGRTDIVINDSEGLVILDQAAAPSPAWIRDVGPVDFASGVPVTVIPGVEFIRTMGAASINSATVRLVNGKTGLAIAATVTYDPATKVARIAPTASLAHNTPYLVWVAGVQDAAGHTLTGPYVSRFVTKL